MAHNLKSPQKLLIWDQEGAPESSDHFVVLWKGYEQNPSSYQLSIPTWISRNQDFVRDQYLNWVRVSYQNLKSHLELYEKMQLDSIINYFQLTPFMEMNLFAKSPQITSILRLIAFDAWAKNEALFSIDYIGGDELLSRTFQKFALKMHVPFTSNVPLAPDHETFHLFDQWVKSSNRTIRSAAWILLKWAKTLPLHRLNLKRWKEMSTKFTFYSYYAHFSPINTSNAEFESSYWGDLPKYLKSIGKHSNWIHMSPSSDGFLTSLKKRFTLKRWSAGDFTQTHVALESFFSAGVMLRAIRNWCKIRFHAKAIHQILSSQAIGNFDFWPYYASEFDRYLSGVGLIDNLLTFELVKTSIQSSAGSHQTFYLFEGQPWEKALNSICVYSNRNLPIAVQHSTVRFWDLRYFQHVLDPTEQDKLESYTPKKVVVNGELSLRLLGDRPPQQELIRLESLRYKRAPSISLRQQLSLDHFSPIILGSYLSEENDFILSLLEEVADQLTGIEFTFKAHPLSTKPFLSKKVTLKQSSQDLKKLLQESTHVLISSSTSAVIEVIEAEIPFAVFLPPSTINLSPLNDVDGIEFLDSSQQLLRFLFDKDSKSFKRLDVGDLLTAHANLDLWKSFIQEWDSNLT